MWQIIADTNCFYLSCFIQLFHSTPGINIQLFPVFISYFRKRPVDQIEIQIIRLKILKSSFKSLFYLRISHLRFPCFGRNKKFFSWYFAFFDCRSKIWFRSIKGCCIKTTISCFDRRFDHSLTLVLRSLIGSESYARNLHSVVQGIAVIDSLKLIRFYCS